VVRIDYASSLIYRHAFAVLELSGRNQLQFEEARSAKTDKGFLERPGTASFSFTEQPTRRSGFITPMRSLFSFYLTSSRIRA
jgi:hypothetical protein